MQGMPGTVRDHIGDRLPYAFEDIGEQRVKNIAKKAVSSRRR
jgi:hypothetical protein